MWSKVRLGFLIAAVLILASCACKPTPVPAPSADPDDAVDFTVPGVDDVPDLYGNPVNPDLVLFFGGNEFMVLPDLLAAFQAEFPHYRRIFCETLPPGILAKQISTGKLKVGNLEITVQPDVITGGKKRIKTMEKSQQVNHTQAYAGNRLAIMVRKGNPKSIGSLRDLQRHDVKVAMPDSSIEDIGMKISEAFVKAGGAGLAQSVLTEKVKDGTTFVTRIHHRQTPLRIVQQESDAGPVWATEVLYQQSINQPVEGVAIPEAENVDSTSVAGVMANSPRPQAAHDFVEFMTGKTARQIYRKYGFLPPS